MNTKKLLTASLSPHIRHEDNTQTIMADVLIALIPALVWAGYIFGARALILTAISVASCVIFEIVSCIVAKRPVRINDLSAVVTGVLLAYTLPPAAPVWMPVLGSFIAIVITKQIFGGIGKNLLNPALSARVILGLFPQAGHYTVPFEELPVFSWAVSAPAAETSLDSLYTGVIPQISEFDMFIGNRVGAIGEVSALLLLAGGLYLLARRVISIHAPISFMAAVLLVAYIFPMNTFKEEFMLYQLLSGSVVFGAVFLSNDPATTPLTSTGKIIFGAGCGLLTMLARYQGNFDGVYYAILIMNLLVPVIDKLMLPRPFGKAREKNRKGEA